MQTLFWSSSHSSIFLPSAACGRGFYKSSSQDLQCSRCPAHSLNDREGSWRCDCEDGYYRALSDPPSVACTSKSAMLLLSEHSTDHLNWNSHVWGLCVDLFSQCAAVSWRPQMCSIAIPHPPRMSLCLLACMSVFCLRLLLMMRGAICHFPSERVQWQSAAAAVRLSWPV